MDKQTVAKSNGWNKLLPLQLVSVSMNALAQPTYLIDSLIV